MEDIAFKYPKKIFRIVIIAAMVIAIGWGVITWNSQKAFDLWEAQVTFIFQPIFNYATNRAEKLVDLAFAPFFKHMEEIGNEPSQTP